jgi:hypothetical protein
MDLKKWNKNIIFNNKNDFAFYIEDGFKYTFVPSERMDPSFRMADITKKGYLCRIYDNDKVIYEFNDLYNWSNDSFLRIKNDRTWKYVDGICIGHWSKLDSSYIRKLTSIKPIHLNFISLDVETRSRSEEYLDKKTGEIKVKLHQDLVLIGLSYTTNGILIYKYFLINDYDSVDNMVNDCIKFLTQREFNNYVVYTHNFTGFDVLYFLSAFSSFENKDPRKLNKSSIIYRDGRVISVILKNVYYKNPKTGRLSYNRITFHDSKLLLLSGLDKLGDAFNIGNKLPFDFVKFANDDLLDPAVIRELIIYNQNDCFLLYNIIKRFSD